MLLGYNSKFQNMTTRIPGDHKIIFKWYTKMFHLIATCSISWIFDPLVSQILLKARLKWVILDITQRKTKSKGCIDYCRHWKRGTIEKKWMQHEEISVYVVALTCPMKCWNKKKDREVETRNKGFDCLLFL